MGIDITFSDDPAAVLREAGAFLQSEPVLHNLILTLLTERAAHPLAGRYWAAGDGGRVVGVAFQSPLDFAATLTPMAGEAVEAMVNAIADAGVALPGVNGEAGTAARFAGQWTERHGSAAMPVQGSRIYEARDVQPGAAVSGRLRRAVAADRELVVGWMRGFAADAGEQASDPEVIVDRRPFWLWEDGKPVSMAGSSAPVEGVVRVQYVYTPPENRKHGYAGACVGELTRQILDGGQRAILYTDLGNPTSNSIYRRIGYRAVAEALRYRFA